MQRQRSKAIDVNMSMTSQHSYFYQADTNVDVTDSVLGDQVSLDDLNSSAIAMGAKVTAKDGKKKGAAHDL